MVRADVISQLENVKDDMRPWVYQLVKDCLTKAMELDDEQAISAFLCICNKNVLWTTSDIDQFVAIRSLLNDTHDTHQEYIDKIHNAFSAIHGEVEGM